MFFCNEINFVYFAEIDHCANMILFVRNISNITLRKLENIGAIS